MKDLMEEQEFEKFCRILERRCRSLGKDCQVIFTDEGVSIAPPKWAGDSFGISLYKALLDAEASVE